MFCPKCGNDVSKAPKFCGKCGHQMGSEAPAPVQQQVAPVQQKVAPVQQQGTPKKKNPLMGKALNTVIFVVFFLVFGGYQSIKQTGYNSYVENYNVCGSDIISAWNLFLAAETPSAMQKAQSSFKMAQLSVEELESMTAPSDLKSVHDLLVKEYTGLVENGIKICQLGEIITGTSDVDSLMEWGAAYFFGSDLTYENARLEFNRIAGEMQVQIDTLIALEDKMNAITAS